MKELALVVLTVGLIFIDERFKQLMFRSSCPNLIVVQLIGTIIILIGMYLYQESVIWKSNHIQTDFYFRGKRVRLRLVPQILDGDYDIICKHKTVSGESELLPLVIGRSKNRTMILGLPHNCNQIGVHGLSITISEKPVDVIKTREYSGDEPIDLQDLLFTKPPPTQDYD